MPRFLKILIPILLVLGALWGLRQTQRPQETNHHEETPFSESPSLETSPTPQSSRPPKEKEEKTNEPDTAHEPPTPPEVPHDSVYSLGERFHFGGDQFFWQLQYENMPLFDFEYGRSAQSKLSESSIPSPPSEPHTRSAQRLAEEKARTLLEDQGCEVLAIGSALAGWYPELSTRVLPAYSVEVYYVCERQRKREDWFFEDPSLRLIRKKSKMI